MSLLQNSNAISAGGYSVDNSVRLRSSASAYLNRTPSSTTNRQIFTWSGWVKRGTLGARQHLFVSANPVVNTAGQQEFQFCFDSSDRIEITGGTSGVGQDLNLTTTQVFRDPSAWYHLVVAIDTTQATSSNRMKLYVNGVQVTVFGTAIYPSQNHNTAVNLINFSHRIGGSGGSYLDAYLAEVNFIDGSAKTPSDFGEIDSTTGVWKPKAYTGTYGTNGFYLKFSDIATTSGSNAGLGKDFSGNGNYWTTNNISVTSGTTYDAMIDSPTNTSATVGNYSVVSPIDVSSVGATISNANLRFNNGNGGAQSTARATIGVSSGKWYWETTCTTFGGSNPDTGILGTNSSLSSADQYVGNYALGYSYGGNGQKRNNNSGSAYGSSYTSGDIIGVALDMDAGTLTFYKNNTSQGTAFTGLSGLFSPAISGYNGVIWDVNFGQRPFSYTPPTGYQALCTTNLPTPTILAGNKYMDATLYTGNGGTQSIVNASGFKPDLVWSKSRSQASGNHLLTDSVRGTTKSLMSNDTGSEGTRGVTAFNSNGFTYVYPNEGGDGNYNAATYVGWQWQAGQGSTSSNTQGSITSTVSVNTTAGFSVITWSGNSTSGATIGHGLGVAPKMFIVKVRNRDEGWVVGHTSIGWSNFLQINNTNASASSAFPFNNTAPSSTLITLGSGSGTNGSTYNYVGYAWAEIAGFSKFGSYVGNGSSDGPFVYTGFRPKYVIFKRTDAVNNWQIQDSVRNPYNATDARLYANLSDAEAATSSILDLCSNGFKIRISGTDNNASGGTYIYMAFAESPFSSNNRAR